MDEKTAFEIVFNKLCTCSLFMGKYDAKHGTPSYMYGINAVMENIAYHIDEETYFNYNKQWVTNIINSKERNK